MEMIAHLLTMCPFFRLVWHEILSWLRFTHGQSLLECWTALKNTTPKPMRKGFTTTSLLVPWMIWKQRNECMFDGVGPSVMTLVARTKDEATLWAKVGAAGLRVVLPATWDVH
jgi:hypothetical protein